MLLRAMLLLALTFAGTARAHHDTPATILGYWDRVAGRNAALFARS